MPQLAAATFAAVAAFSSSQVAAAGGADAFTQLAGRLADLHDSHDAITGKPQRMTLEDAMRSCVRSGASCTGFSFRGVASGSVDVSFGQARGVVDDSWASYRKETSSLGQGATFSRHDGLISAGEVEVCPSLPPSFDMTPAQAWSACARASDCAGLAFCSGSKEVRFVRRWAEPVHSPWATYLKSSFLAQVAVPSQTGRLPEHDFVTVSILQSGKDLSLDTVELGLSTRDFARRSGLLGEPRNAGLMSSTELPARRMSITEARRVCTASPLCNGFSFQGGEQGTADVRFRPHAGLRGECWTSYKRDAGNAGGAAAVFSPAEGAMPEETCGEPLPRMPAGTSVATAAELCAQARARCSGFVMKTGSEIRFACGWAEEKQECWSTYTKANHNDLDLDARSNLQEDMDDPLHLAQLRIHALESKLAASQGQVAEAERISTDVDGLHAQILHLQLELKRVSGEKCAEVSSEFLPRHSGAQSDHDGSASTKPISMQLCLYIEDPVAAKACELAAMQFVGDAHLPSEASLAVKKTALEAEAMAKQSESEAKQAALDLAAAEARLKDLLSQIEADEDRSGQIDGTTVSGGSEREAEVNEAKRLEKELAATELVRHLATSAGPVALGTVAGSAGHSSLAERDDSDWAKAAKWAGCAQHSGCHDLEGLCCPTALGLFLECCGAVAFAEQQPAQERQPVPVSDAERGWN